MGNFLDSLKSDIDSMPFVQNMKEGVFLDNLKNLGKGVAGVLADVAAGLGSFVAPELVNDIKDDFTKAEKAKSLDEFIKRLESIRKRVSEANSKGAQLTSEYDRLTDVINGIKNLNISQNNISAYRAQVASELDKAKLARKHNVKEQQDVTSALTALADEADLARSSKNYADSYNPSYTQLINKNNKGSGQLMQDMIDDEISALRKGKNPNETDKE